MTAKKGVFGCAALPSCKSQQLISDHYHLMLVTFNSNIDSCY